MTLMHQTTRKNNSTSGGAALLYLSAHFIHVDYVRAVLGLRARMKKGACLLFGADCFHVGSACVQGKPPLL